MTDACSGARRYLALWFPFLSAERLRAEAGAPDPAVRHALPDAPLALVARAGNALRLAATDARAQALSGLAPGQALADAVRVIRISSSWRWTSGRQTLPRPTGAAVRGLFAGAGDRSARWDHTRCDRRRPFVRRRRQAGRRSRRPAGHDWPDGAPCARRGRRGGARAGLAARFLAPTNRPQSALFPIVALGLEEEATLGLRRAGLKTVGDVATRPVAAIAARFGLTAVDALRRLLGETHAPIDPLPHRAPLRFERRFAEPIGQQAAVAAAFLELLRQAAKVLAERHLGGRRFRLTLFRSDGAKRRRLTIETGAPTRDPALVLRLFDERIAALADPLDPGFGYDSIALASTGNRAARSSAIRSGGGAEGLLLPWLS